jgi:hypothetical protein
MLQQIPGAMLRAHRPTVALDPSLRMGLAPLWTTPDFTLTGRPNYIQNSPAGPAE